MKIPRIFFIIKTMLSNVDAPTGFFSYDVEEIITVSSTVEIILQPPIPIIPVTSVKQMNFNKFSFSKFGSSKFTKNIKTEESKTVLDQKSSVVEAVDEYKIYKGTKVKYVYDRTVKPRLDKNTNITADFSILLQQLEANKYTKKSEAEIENKNAINDTMDMFTGMDGAFQESFVDEANKNEMLIKADEYISKLSRNMFLGKPDKVIKAGILPPALFECIYELFKYMNPEERGKMLINIIFGGLISKAKLSGPAGKSAPKEFPKIVDAISKLTQGGTNHDIGSIYNRTLEYIITNGGKYRSDLAASEQITNVANLINKIVKKGLIVYFPSNLLFFDPIVIKDVPTKSVPLSGIPTLENMNEFFDSGKQISQKANATIKTNKKSEELKKAEDKKKGFVGKSYDMEDMF